MYIDLSKIKTTTNKRKVALVHDFLVRGGGAEKVLKTLTKIYPDAPIYTLFYNKSFVKENFSDCEIRASFLQSWYQFLLKITGGSRPETGGSRPAPTTGDDQENDVGAHPGVRPPSDVGASRGSPAIGNGSGNKSSTIHRLLAPLMPLAAESLDLSKFNTIISSTSYATKGIICSTNITHICYVHTPTRWLWQDKEINARLRKDERKMKFKSGGYLPASVSSPKKKQEIRNKKSLVTRYWLLVTRYINPFTYLRLIKRTIAKIFVHFLRIWDYEAAQRPDILIANSAYTAQRIKKYYGRDAKVIYPPAVAEINARLKQDERKIGIESGEHLPSSATSPNKKQEIRNKKYFITISRLSRYKKIDVAIRAFNDLRLNLLVVGEGPELKRLQKIAGSNIYFAGFIEDEELFKKTIKKAKALVHPAEEDLGMVMVEALSLGVPVIAPNCGGAREIVKPGVNGELFLNQESRIKNHESEITSYGLRVTGYGRIYALKNAVRRLITNYASYDPEEIKKSAGRFTEKGFAKSIRGIVNQYS